MSRPRSTCHSHTPASAATRLPHACGFIRLADPEDRARGDWEPRGKKKKSKRSKGGIAAAGGSDSEPEGQQQQQRRSSEELLQQQLHGLTLQQGQQQHSCDVPADAGQVVAAAVAAADAAAQNGSNQPRPPADQQHRQQQCEVSSCEGQQAAHAVTAVVA